MGKEEIMSSSIVKNNGIKEERIEMKECLEEMFRRKDCFS